MYTYDEPARIGANSMLMVCSNALYIHIYVYLFVYFPGDLYRLRALSCEVRDSGYISCVLRGTAGYVDIVGLEILFFDI